MAEHKKGFVLYADLIHTVKKLPKDKAGELFLHILMYVNDENPITEDLIISLTFEPIKQQLKRDLGKWAESRLKRAEAGRKGGQATQSNAKQNEAMLDNAKQSQANQAVIVSVKDISNSNSEGNYCSPPILENKNLEFSGNAETTHKHITEDAEFISRSAIHLGTSEAIFKAYCKRKVDGWALSNTNYKYHISALRKFIIDDYEKDKQKIAASVNTKKYKDL